MHGGSCKADTLVDYGDMELRMILRAHMRNQTSFRLIVCFHYDFSYIGKEHGAREKKWSGLRYFRIRK